MPNNSSSGWGNATAAGLILGAVLATAYAAYNLFTESTTNQPNENRSHSRTSNTSNVSDQHSENGCCTICGRPITPADVYHLPCMHTFHQVCLQAHIIVRGVNPQTEYKCTTCERIVSRETLNDILH